MDATLQLAPTITLWMSMQWGRGTRTWVTVLVAPASSPTWTGLQTVATSRLTRGLQRGSTTKCPVSGSFVDSGGGRGEEEGRGGGERREGRGGGERREESGGGSGGGRGGGREEGGERRGGGDAHEWFLFDAGQRWEGEEGLEEDL